MVIIMKSIWINENTKPLPSINSNKKCETLIIGAGITGITLSYFLKDKDVILIDKGIIGYGKTSFSTGKVTYLQDGLIKGNKNKEDLYLKSQIESMKLLKEIIKKEKIDCDIEKNISILYAKCKNEKKNLLKIRNILKRNNIKFNYSNENYINTISINDSYVINPYKLIINLKDKLKDKVKIYENSKATSYTKENNKYYVKVNEYIIECKNLVISTHYPFLVRFGLIPFKTSIEKSILTASVTKDNLKFNAISEDGKISIRYYTNNKENYFIFLSNSNKLSKNIDNVKITNDTVTEANKTYGKIIEYIWSNTDIISPDKIPFAGRLKENIFIATGYSTWGLTNGVLSSKIISDQILGNTNKYESITNPKRITNILTIIKNNLDNAKAFIASKLIEEYPFYDERVKIYKEKGKTYGKYIDDNGKEHIVNITCPHMGCSLVFNYVDKTWDCPCHSSRFDIDGNVISEPSFKNINKD